MMRGACLMVLLVCAATTVCADSLRGTFTFQKVPPSVALLYFPEDTSLAPNAEVVVDQADKEFSPTLVVTTPGSKVIFRNSDTVKHNIFARDSKANVQVDLGLLSPGEDVAQAISWEDTAVKFGCKIHPKMRMWVASIASKYYKIVEFATANKSFDVVIEGIPEQLSTVRVWLPKYPSRDVSIKKGESKEVVLYDWGDTADTLTLVRR